MDNSIKSEDIFNTAFAMESEEDIEPQKRKRHKKKISNCSQKDNKCFHIGYKHSTSVKTANVYYNKHLCKGLCKSHILYKENIDAVLLDVIKINTGVNAKIEIDILKRNPLLFTYFSKLHKLIKNFPFKFLLEHHCKKSKLSLKHKFHKFTSEKCVIADTFVEQINNCAPCFLDSQCSSQNTEDEEQLIVREVPRDEPIKKLAPLNDSLSWIQVYRFLISVTHKLVPVQIFGSKHNKKCFYKALKKFINLGKKEAITIQDVIYGVKMSDFRWASGISNYTVRTKLICMVWLWHLNLMTHVIKSFFYVTEASCYKHMMVYYCKDTWMRLYDAAFYKLIKANKMCLLEKGKIQQMYDANKKDILHFALQNATPIRFLPKTTGMRPILPFQQGNMESYRLQTARIIIGAITELHKEGSNNVRLFKDFQNCWINYTTYLKTNSINSELVYVKVDIQDAFGSIDLCVLEKLLRDGVKKLPTTFKIARHLMPNSKKLKCFRVDDFGRMLKAVPGAIKYSEVMTFITSDVVERIVHLLCTQMVKKRGENYLVKKGVPQGGGLSCSFCELYYSALCKKHLTPYETDGSIILRSVDDFLYVTPSRYNALSFLERMEKGFPEFSCFINMVKTAHNIDNDSNHVCFRGIVVCIKTKQLFVDTFSISAVPPRYSILIRNKDKPGQLICKKIYQLLNARLPSLVLHPTYMSPRGSLSNVWKAAVLTGSRLVALLVHLTPMSIKEMNSSHVMRCIISQSNIIWAHIKALWRKSGISISQWPYPKLVFVTVVFMGIIAVLSLPRQKPMPKLKACLQRKVKIWTQKIEPNYLAMLPRIPQKLVNMKK